MMTEIILALGQTRLGWQERHYHFSMQALPHINFLLHSRSHRRVTYKNLTGKALTNDTSHGSNNPKGPHPFWTWIARGGPLIPIDYDKEKRMPLTQRLKRMLLRRVPLLSAITIGFTLPFTALPRSEAKATMERHESTSPWSSNVKVYASSPQAEPAYSWGTFLPEWMQGSWFTSNLIRALESTQVNSFDEAFNLVSKGYGPPKTPYKTLKAPQSSQGPSQVWLKHEASEHIKQSRVALLIQGGRENGYRNVSSQSLLNNVNQIQASLKKVYNLKDQQIKILNEPSLEELMQTLKDIASQNPSEILIYISSEGFSMSYDTLPSDKEGSNEGYILLNGSFEYLPESTLKDSLSRTFAPSPQESSPSITLVIDACESGAFVE